MKNEVDQVNRKKEAESNDNSKEVKWLSMFACLGSACLGSGDSSAPFCSLVECLTALYHQ
jgi:hypothetical protein